MAAQSGKDMLLKLDTTGLGAFVSVAGLRARNLSLNAASIDTTDAQSLGGWRELLSGGGIKRASISGGGVFKDAASDAKIRQIFFDGAIRNWQMILPDFGIIAGLFQIIALEFSGDHNSELRFEIALESAGVMTFTPVEV